jgi:hypothetical protein
MLRSISAGVAPPVPPELAGLDAEYAANPWRWMCEQCVTVDEALQIQRPWPADREDLRELVEDVLPVEPKIMILKSRRMFVTWTLAAWMLHRIRYHAANACYWQAEMEDKAAWVVHHRHWYLEKNLLNDDLRRLPTISKTSGGQVGKMIYSHPGADSEVKALSQGGDVLRQYTASMIVIDESEFQRYSHETMKAALPLLESGKNVQLILASTANGPSGVIAGTARDLGVVRWDGVLRQTKVVVPRLRHKTGTCLCLMHYSLDPAKDRAWLEQESQKFDRQEDWDQEMELSTQTVSGNRVYSHYSESGNVREWIRYDPALPLRLACDFNVDPMAWVVAQYVAPNLYILDEFFLSPGSVEEAFQQFLTLYGEHRGQVIVYGGADGHNRQQRDGRSNYDTMKYLSIGRSYKLSVRAPRKAYNVDDSVHSVNMMLRDPAGQSHMYIDRERCPELVNDLLEVVWAEAGGRKVIRKESNPTNPYFLRTHTAEGLRGMVQREWPTGRQLRRAKEQRSSGRKERPKRKKPLIAEMGV